MFRKPELTDSASLLETFKFLENAAADFSDEEDVREVRGEGQCVFLGTDATWSRLALSKEPSSCCLSPPAFWLGRAELFR